MQEITFKEVYLLYKEYEIVAVASYQDNSGGEFKTATFPGTPEQQILAAISAGATSINIKLKNSLSGVIDFCVWRITELVQDEYSSMENKRMAGKLRSGEAIDVSTFPRSDDGYYELDDFIEGKDYCDKEMECWIWSVGIHYHTHQVLASTSTVFYDNPDFHCLFLR